MEQTNEVTAAETDLHRDKRCLYCFRELAKVKSACLLPCKHVSCLKCLHLDLSINGKLTCPACRQEVSKSLDELPRLDFKKKTNETSKEVVKCDCCEDQDAIAFCEDCNRKICERKIQPHNDYFGDSHKTVKISTYSLSPSSFIKKTCSHHNVVISMACLTCHQLFCTKCDLLTECQGNETGGHRPQALELVEKQVKSSIEKLLDLASESLVKLCHLEKGTWTVFDDLEVRKKKLIEEVQSLADRKISFIRKKTEQAVADIEARFTAHTTDVENDAASIHSQIDEIEKVRVETFKFLYNCHVTDLVTKQVEVSTKLQESTLLPTECYQSRQHQLPSLYTSVICKSEFSLTLDLPLSQLKFESKRATDSYCRYVIHLRNGHFVAGCDNGVKVYDAQSNFVCEVVGSKILGLACDDDFLYVAFPSDGKIGVQIYNIADWSPSVNHRFVLPLIGDVSLAAYKKNMAFINNNKDKIIIFDIEKSTQRAVSLAGMTGLLSLYFGRDGSLYVSTDSSVVKYNITKDEVVWTCANLLGAAGMAASADAKYLFVGSETGRKVYLLSKGGELLKELKDPKIPPRFRNISVFEQKLAIACQHEKQIKFFNLEK